MLLYVIGFGMIWCVVMVMVMVMVMMMMMLCELSLKPTETMAIPRANSPPCQIYSHQPRETFAAFNAVCWQDVVQMGPNNMWYGIVNQQSTL